jgi:hypothetical protein
MKLAELFLRNSLSSAAWLTLMMSSMNCVMPVSPCANATATPVLLTCEAGQSDGITLSSGYLARIHRAA